MCKIIHTDFKPENVVICLRDDEVAEIAQTGQLTTTKMFNKGDIIKRVNMKIAGTLPPSEVAKPAEDKGDKVWDVDMEGLTAKQKKNLRKKLQRQRRKNQKQDGTTVNESKDGDNEQEEETKVVEKPVMSEISNQVLNKPEQQAKPRNHVKKGSIDGLDHKLNNLLLDDEEEQIQVQADGEPKKKRGPKIDENVMVKICDMGNGCWTYHHFTPEI